MTPEQEALQQLVQKNPEGLKALYDLHHQALYRFLRSDLNREDAEEALQDVFLVVWEKAATCKGTSVVAWLFGIARNVARNRSRKVRYTHELLESDAVMQQKESSEFELVLGAVRQLPEHERSVVELVYLAELSLQEAASSLKLPLGTVKRRLHTARNRLRDLLGGEYV